MTSSIVARVFSHHEKKSLANLLEVFTFETELVEDPVTSARNATKGDAANAGVTVIVALRSAREEAENAKVELAKITKAQKGMEETLTKETDKMREKCEQEIIACKTTALESQKTFGRERDEANSSYFEDV